MKLSLRWITEHIADIAWDKLDVEKLINRFSITTAEIEQFKKISFDPVPFALAQLIAHNNNQSLFYCPEWGIEFPLSLRKDSITGALYLVKKESNVYRYATIRDFHGDKEGFVPALFCTQEQAKGAWKANCITEDYILTIDNNGISHRPDLWSHRGIAREMAALLNLKLLSEEQITIPCLIKNYDLEAPATTQNPFSIEIQAPTGCKRFASLFLEHIESKHSLPFVAQRLASIDARPINALVDTTNYVMYDLGQPMHAFDAAHIPSHLVTVAYAQEASSLHLLDGETITLSSQDLVITNGTEPISLAGIMGGQSTSISSKTDQILVESASFDPLIIRRSSSRYKKRTDASTRFEKGLDPNQNTFALMRFLYLLKEWQLYPKAQFEKQLTIISLGRLVHEQHITITHDTITKKIGVTLTPQDIMPGLIKRGFGVQESVKTGELYYTITVPTFRLRDVALKEDIVEEVARIRGYDMIPYHIPSLPLRPHDNGPLLRTRAIKQHCAFGLGMHEISSYPVYDEEFLQLLKWQPAEAVEIKNPISERWRYLSSSLVPQLCKAVMVNSDSKELLRFFEWASVWNIKENKIEEKKSLALLWYQPQEAIDFYAQKNELMSLFALLKLPVQWRTWPAPMPWYQSKQTAALYHDEQLIGYAGTVSPTFLNKVVPHGTAFVAELQGSYLQHYKSPFVPFTALSKYPSSDLDISMFVPFSVTVAQLEQAIAFADARIRDVYLIDSFEKGGEQPMRSITFRYTILDDFKTLTKEEIEEVARSVKEAVKQNGVTVR